MSEKYTYLGSDLWMIPNAQIRKSLWNKYQRNEFDIVTNLEGNPKTFWVIGDCTNKQLDYLKHWLCRFYGEKIVYLTEIN